MSLAIFVADVAHPWFSSNQAVYEFDADRMADDSPAALSALGRAQDSPDFSLWSEDQMRAYRRSLAAVDETETVSRNDRVLRALTAPSVTLATCYPFDFISDAPKRYLLHTSLEWRDAGNSMTRREGR